MNEWKSEEKVCNLKVGRPSCFRYEKFLITKRNKSKNEKEMKKK